MKCQQATCEMEGGRLVDDGGMYVRMREGKKHVTVLSKDAGVCGRFRSNGHGRLPKRACTLWKEARAYPSFA